MHAYVCECVCASVCECVCVSVCVCVCACVFNGCNISAEFVLIKRRCGSYSRSELQ